MHPNDLDIDDFLMAMHHLKRYPTDLEREPIFNVDCMRGRNRVSFFVEKIRQLKWEKIVWPADDFGSDLWVMSVDGVHFWIREPQHLEWSLDKTYLRDYSSEGLRYCGLGLVLKRSAYPDSYG